jgi:2-keto-4-pentenoate hydratase/2-oxohepta-3-ene-1,7-dioic acid hydratase in catechol pathway
MFVARILVTAGPLRGLRSYARVENNGASYRPVPDPFETDGGGAGAESPAHQHIPASDATLLAPCRPRLVVGMAHNTGAADRRLPPQAFLKSPHTVVGPGESIVIPAGRTRVESEGEVAVVIGSLARDLTEDTALAAVFGYTCANDVTDRAAQVSDSLWTEAKSPDTFTPLGPWIRTDLNPDDVEITVGDDDGFAPVSRTSGLARNVAELLVYLSSVMTLHPGDVVLAGAPGPGRALRPGGTSTIDIAGIGVLANPVSAGAGTVADRNVPPHARHLEQVSR